MTSRVLRRLLVIVVTVITPALAATRVEAQWYSNPITGFSGVVPYYNDGTARLVNQINDRATVSAQTAYASRAGAGHVDVGNPYYRNRDVTYFERFDAETRRAMENRVARRPSAPPPRSPSATPPSTAQAPAPVKPILPLPSFFNKYEELVWPGEAPTVGDLKPKRDASDQATKVALQEYNEQGQAKVATVTEARSRLLDYGRPALQYVREHTTARIADSFHLFLLSLYDSLGQAATNVRTSQPPRS